MDAQHHHGSALHSLARCGLIAAGLLLAYALLPLRGDRWWVGALVGFGLLAAVFPLTVRRVRRVMTSSRPIYEVLEALVLLVTMLITGFAAVYFAMNRNGTEFHGLDNRIDGVYFTIVTLGTVGFGDITPASDAARIIVSVQILFDLVFIGLAVRVLTTAARRRAQSEGRHPL